MKRAAGRFTKHQLIKMERREPEPCYRKCWECKKKFKMIEKDQVWCSPECHESLEEKWEKRKQRNEAN